MRRHPQYDNVHKISDLPINYKTKHELHKLHELHELNSKFSNLDINSNTELILFYRKRTYKFG